MESVPSPGISYTHCPSPASRLLPSPLPEASMDARGIKLHTWRAGWGWCQETMTPNAATGWNPVGSGSCQDPYISLDTGTSALPGLPASPAPPAPPGDLLCPHASSSVYRHHMAQALPVAKPLSSLCLRHRGAQLPGLSGSPWPSDHHGRCSKGTREEKSRSC